MPGYAPVFIPMLVLFMLEFIFYNIIIHTAIHPTIVINQTETEINYYFFVSKI